MRLAVGRPSASWVEWAAAAADRAQASAVLVLTLEAGQYWTREQGRFGGRKAVERGTSIVLVRCAATSSRDGRSSGRPRSGIWWRS
jgi:hypothetical protein